MVNIAAGVSSETIYYGDETSGVPTITAYNSVTVIAYGSTSLTINPNPPTQLVYTTRPPATTTAGSGTSFSVVVSEEDQYNNVVTTDNTTSVPSRRATARVTVASPAPPRPRWSIRGWQHSRTATSRARARLRIP